MKLARKSFGDPYKCKQNWEEDTFVQCGDKGVVFSKKGGYTTAFFEAYPIKPKCFIRGEGKDVEEAELNAWDKYQKIISCNHEMERRDRVDGYGYCKYCSYSSMVFESLNKCCKCKKPTNYARDYKKNWYCKKHSVNKPKNPNLSERNTLFTINKKYRCPRKDKKILIRNISERFRNEGIFGKIKFRVTILNDYVFSCDEKEIHLMFKDQKRKYMKSYKFIKL